ncbi:MAG TPA: response regulator [Patescibacteria group bacterium]
MSKILVVDDDPTTRYLIAEILKRKYGHEVSQAENGREAMGILREVKPDLIVSDVFMPEADCVTDGITLLSTLRLGGDDIPVILISCSLPDDLRSAVKRADAFFEKPLDFSELHKCINRLLSQQ